MRGSNRKSGAGFTAGGSHRDQLAIRRKLKNCLWTGLAHKRNRWLSLDPDSPNVAVLTPSLGLVPYLDIALRTRFSDNLSLLGQGG